MTQQARISNLEPITKEELSFINETLDKYSSKEFSLDISELDGFVTGMTLSA